MSKQQINKVAVGLVRQYYNIPDIITDELIVDDLYGSLGWAITNIGIAKESLLSELKKLIPFL